MTPSFADEAKKTSLSTIFRQGLFAGKVAIVTGGGTGIGFRTAQELGMLGAQVVVCSRNQKKCEQAAATLRQQGYDAFGCECNIRKEESISRCLDQVLAKYGAIDLLVNNGGGQFPCPAESISKKGWHAVIETNLTGTFCMSQAVFTRYMKAHGGVIVNVVADMWRGFPTMSHTGAARAGVVNLTKSLAVEWAHHGVRVCAVAPGVILSSGLETYPEDFKKRMSATLDNYSFRWGSVGEISAAILFLLSPASQFTTGITLNVDGGAPLYNKLYPPQSHTKMPAKL